MVQEVSSVLGERSSKEGAVMWRIVLLLVHLLAAPLLGQAPGRVDPDVVPAQFVGNPVPGGVVDPPTPQVRLQIRTPAAIAPNQDITYKIIVTNVSAAEAYKVTVRCPIPATMQSLTKAEPNPE
jgi:uncharacterized repeat protein (TIGR01451 family)